MYEIAGLGFDAIWLMGVWRISDGARKISKIISEDFEGSPYAVPDYRLNPDLGGKPAFTRLVERAHSAGLRVIVDFVSNHTALDSPWISSHPEFFIRNNPSVRTRGTGDYFLHKSGELIAFGRDPYFPPWHDTAQLDYANPGLRSHMTEVLKRISRLADGVRCDMAMLALRDYVRHYWYPQASDEWFNERMPDEFWGRAIAEVKAARPDFLFIAEAYWDKEQQLLDLGFDLAYEKKLYDGLVSGNVQLVKERLGRGPQAMKSSLCFIENHDEARAASVFTTAGNIAAMAMLLSLPCSVLVHQGQMEGKREKLPVQRVRPLHDEPADAALKIAYTYLLQITSEEIFQKGSFEVLETGVPGMVSIVRKHSGRAVAYFGQVSDAWERFNAARLDVSPLARALGATERVRVTNLVTSASEVIENRGGAFILTPAQISVDDDARFCLIEAALP